MEKVEKSIKVNEEIYKMLNEFVGELRAEEKRPVSMNEAIGKLLGKNKKRDIMECAGLWEMSDEEALKIKKELKKAWKTWKPKQF